MGIIITICAALAVAIYAPEIFEKAKALFKFVVDKLKSLWSK